MTIHTLLGENLFSRKKQLWKLTLTLCISLSLSGCVKLALRAAPSFIPHLSQTFFEECDTDLARQSMPSSLKIMEGLLKNDSENKQILTTLCTGFTGYAMLFIEDNNPDRASKLYLRARDYGFKALGKKAPISKESKLSRDAIQARIKLIEENDLETLFWTTMAWNAWINLNLDKPVALGQLNTAQACLDRILEIKPDYYYGAPYILMGSILAAMPGPLGGDEKQASQYFKKSLQTADGNFFLAHYYFARYYAVRVQDKELFFKLIKEVEQKPANMLKDACLINSVMKEKIIHLKEISEDLFL